MKKLKIKFVGPGINIIKGDSEAGKTALFRFIKLVVFNRPTNSAKKFTSSGKKTYRGKIVTTEGSVTRTTRKYIVEKNENKQILTSFGKDVPDPVTKTLNLKPINFQSQFNHNYIIFQNESQAAKTLEKAFGNEDQEKLIKELKKWISEAKSDYKHHLKNKKECKETIKRLSRIKEFKEEIEEIRELEENIESIENEMKDISKLLQTLEKIEKEKIDLDFIEYCFSECKAIEELDKKVSECSNELRNLGNLIHTLENTESSIKLERISNWLQESHRLYFLDEKINKLDDQISRIKPLIKQLDECEDIKEIKVMIEKCEEEIKNTLNRIPECPFMNICERRDKK